MVGRIVGVLAIVGHWEKAPNKEREVRRGDFCYPRKMGVGGRRQCHSVLLQSLGVRSLDWGIVTQREMKICS